MNKNILLLLVLFFSAATALPQSVLGKWKTIDDESGEAKAIVEIYEKEGEIFGEIVQILQKGKENAVCTKCEGEDKGRPYVGIHVIQNMRKDDDGRYKGGRVIDPEHGLNVRGKIWLDPKNPDHLMVRGYLAFLYRTQKWIRLKS